MDNDFCDYFSGRFLISQDNRSIWQLIDLKLTEQLLDNEFCYPFMLICIPCLWMNSTSNQSPLVDLELSEQLLDIDFCDYFSWRFLVSQDNRSLNPQTPGRIASYYYLHHRTVRMFQDSLGPECSIPDLITVLSDAHEYEGLPVRHNEDTTNRWALDTENFHWLGEIVIVLLFIEMGWDHLDVRGLSWVKVFHP